MGGWTSDVASIHRFLPRATSDIFSTPEARVAPMVLMTIKSALTLDGATGSVRSLDNSGRGLSMYSRRSFLAASAKCKLALTTDASTLGSAQTSLPVLGEEQGDPQATPDPVSYDPDIVAQLIWPVSAKSFSIVDSVSDFPAQLIAVAETFNGNDRLNSHVTIAKMLNLFGCPFEENGHPLAFCAAGIGYCSTLVFARANKIQRG